MAGRGRGRRGRGGRTPRSSRNVHHGAMSAPSSSSVEEGFWRYDFLLCVLSRTTAWVTLPSSFASIVSELNLRVIWLHLQGCVRSPSWVELEVDSSCLIFLGSGWRSFSQCLNLRDGDSLCCRFDGEDTLTVRAFDAGGNRLHPYWEETSSDSSSGTRNPSSASPATSSLADSSGGGACSSSSKDELDVMPFAKRVRR